MKYSILIIATLGLVACAEPESKFPITTQERVFKQCLEKVRLNSDDITAGTIRECRVTALEIGKL